MAKSKNIPSVAACQDNLRPFIGSAPLLDGEDGAAYEALRSRFFSAVLPTDIVEEMWVSDCVDLTWEILRLRRLKVKRLSYFVRKKVIDEVKYHYQADDRDQLADEWYRREPETVASVQEVLQSKGLDEETVVANELFYNKDSFEKIERLIAALESRRNMMLREIDRHRDALSRRLREVSHEITDGEFVEVSTDKLKAAE